MTPRQRERLGRNITRQMKGLSVSVEGLAFNLFGTTQDDELSRDREVVVSRWINGADAPTMNDLARLAQALRCNVAQLMEGV